MSLKGEGVGGFKRNVILVAGGTAFAQFVSLLFIPLLTRLYTPSDFAVLALVGAIVAITSSVACLRFEVAIPIPAEDKAGFELLCLALFSCVILSLFFSAIFFIFIQFYDDVIDARQFWAIWSLLSVGMIFIGGYRSLQFWSTRKKNFGDISRTRVTQSLSGVTAQVVSGFAGLGGVGLVLGLVLTQAGGVFYLVKRCYLDIKTHAPLISYVGLRDAAAEYSNFPKYSALEALFSATSLQLPILIIAVYADSAELGCLALALKIMAAPVLLVGNAVAQVFLAEASKADARGELEGFTTKLIGKLLLIGGPLLVTGGVVAKLILPVVLGSEWGRVGELMVWMLPWFVLQFITSPVYMVFNVRNRQRYALVLQVSGLVLRCLPIVVVGELAVGFLSEVYAVSSFMFYVLYFYAVADVANIQLLELMKSCFLGAALSLLAIGGGIVVLSFWAGA
ncbi:lipopolysaccharide biosynthesis protein [Halopseudomonas oceani]|uniref:lipopolysaccharide biosynthesis protein n=1 Tax=Halopseudomonas oceani TaxID=1708783 RepID=UPI002AA7D680|nr:lipopolysaccharide biosynthesis protein [Halopseudomonas oceani]